MARTETADSDLVSIADVGLGVGQALPVFVACVAARPHSTVYIEQPELHLHPHAQVRLMRFLAESANRGPYIVVETHCSLMLRELQTIVAEGGIKPGIVTLHWFTRDPGTGSTRVSSAFLDKDGSFGDWPEDFGNINLDSEKRYLDAVDRRHGF